MKTKYSLLLFFLMYSMLFHSQPKISYQPQLNKVREMFKTGNVGVIAPVVLKNYTIKGIPVGFESKVLEAIIDEMPRFDSYKIVSEKDEAAGTRVTAVFMLKKGNEKLNSNFLISKAGKIIELNILENANVKMIQQMPK